MFYYVYVLQSINTDKLYIGFTKDLRKRVAEHNIGKSQSTKPFIPYRFIYYEGFLSKKDATKREEYLKTGYGLRSIKTMLTDYFRNRK